MHFTEKTQPLLLFILDTPVFSVVPPYGSVETIYFSTRLPPNAPDNSVYHVIACIARTQLTDPQGQYPATVFLDPEGNVVPFYPNNTDKNGKTLSDFYYKNLHLDEGYVTVAILWVYDLGFLNL